MKKKLSVLIVSCFLLSTPCFAFDGHNHKHKAPPPPKHKHHIEHIHKHHCIKKFNQYYDNYSYTTEEDIEIAKIQGITDIIISLLD